MGVEEDTDPYKYGLCWREWLQDRMFKDGDGAYQANTFA